MVTGVYDWLPDWMNFIVQFETSDFKTHEECFNLLMKNADVIQRIAEEFKTHKIFQSNIPKFTTLGGQIAVINDCPKERVVQAYAWMAKGIVGGEKAGNDLKVLSHMILGMNLIRFFILDYYGTQGG